MPFLENIYFQVFTDAGGRLPVVLLHGAGGSHLSWPVILRRLPRASVYALDLPGHGSSAGPPAPSVQDYAGRVLDWMRAAGLPRVVLVGHSMGGAIALTLALERPEGVAGLALLGCAARLPVNPTLIAAASNPESYPLAVEKIVQWSFSRGTPANLSNLVARRLLSLHPGVMRADLLACDAFDLSGRLSEIRCPALVLCGSEDRMTPPSNAQKLAESIPAARLHILSGAGHMLMLENPAAVAQALGDFLAGQAAGAQIS